MAKTRTYTIRSPTSHAVIMSSCRKTSAGVDGGMSGGSSVRRPVSEDPHQCQRNFNTNNNSPPFVLFTFLTVSGNSGRENYWGGQDFNIEYTSVTYGAVYDYYTVYLCF